MPFVRISLIRGKSPEHIRAISQGVHQALVDAYAIPADDRFQVIQQHEPHELVYDAHYLGIRRSDDIVFVQIVAGNWRDTTQKRTLFRNIADNLAASPGLDPADVLVVLSPNERDEWSFGNGVASYVDEGQAR